MKKRGVRPGPGFVVLQMNIWIRIAIGFPYLLFRLSSIPYPTLALGVSPGGIAEMAITARVLQLGVPMVTSFQVARMVFVLVLTGPLYQSAARLLRVS